MAMSVITEPIFSEPERRTLRQKFDRIKQNVNISQVERQAKRGHVQGILDQVIQAMKQEEPLFNIMFVELKYTGSYFDDLRINNANEFDINVVLKLPVRSDRQVLEAERYAHSDYATLRVDYSNGDPTVNLDYGPRGRFSRCLQGDVVHSQKTLSWFQSVVDKACNSLNSSQFHFSSSGPARTLKIKYPGQSQTVDVDLVPVFRLESGKWNEDSPHFQHQIVNRMHVSRRRMYLVPKRLPGCPEHTWRKHFPEVEEELLNGTVAAKPVIRIMKLLRDNLRLDSVASYVIKTLVMLEHEEHLGDYGYWNDDQLPTLVFRMMTKLANYFRSGTLPHLLYRDINHLTNFARIELDNYYGRMKHALNRCQADINYVDELFKRPTTA